MLPVSRGAPALARTAPFPKPTTGARTSLSGSRAAAYACCWTANRKGASLRHLMARGEYLNRTSGGPVVVVPARRCLADHRALVLENLSAR